MPPKFTPHEKKRLRDLGLSESWLQDQVRSDTRMLGLGDLQVVAEQKPLPHSGRIDLLLADPDSERRYVVEIQLGPTDPSHIVRTLEYWDEERGRYPNYEHIAVLVAEDVTTRFLRVLSLFNGAIPFVALQMNALQVGDQFILSFTRVLDPIVRVAEEEDEGGEPADRSLWAKRVPTDILATADRLLEMTKRCEGSAVLRYRKTRIGIGPDGNSQNIAVLTPKKQWIRVRVWAPREEKLDAALEASGLQWEYDTLNGRYRVWVLPKTTPEQTQVVEAVIKAGCDAFKS